MGLRDLTRASSGMVADLQARVPPRVATIDLDATVVASPKQAAQPRYGDRHGYQLVEALWVEQDAIIADEYLGGSYRSGAATNV